MNSHGRILLQHLDHFQRIGWQLWTVRLLMSNVQRSEQVKTKKEQLRGHRCSSCQARFARPLGTRAPT